jgi:hypothetical protein
MSAGPQFHEEFHREEPHLGGSDRAFGFVFASVCATIGGINFWRGHHAWPWWLSAATVFVVLALAYPRALNPLNRLWTKFGLLLHLVVQPVVMGLLFFGTIVPMGFLIRVMGKDLLRLRLDPSARSYWIERNPPGPSPDSFKNQF